MLPETKLLLIWFHVCWCYSVVMCHSFPYIYHSKSKTRARSRRIEGSHPYLVEINEWNAPLAIPRIIGGKEAKQGKYPFMASLTYQKNHVCGGTLIADDIVLSAAHCADFFEGVSVGRHDLSKDDEAYEKFNIEKFVIHPRYQTSNSLVSSMDNDFMLIKLYGWSSEVDKPIELNTKPDIPIVDENCDVVGWGVTDTVTDETSDILKEVSVNVMTNAECSKKKGKMDGFSQLFSLEGKITGNMLCAADDGEDACQGDSGGPLIRRVGKKKVQVGVVSWGLDCAHPVFPGVYSRVSNQFKWINKVVCEWAESPPEYFGCNKTIANEDDDGIEKRSVTIDILLDRFPTETGFLLRSGITNYAYGPIGVYKGKENQRMTVVLDLEVNKEYTFIMLDAYGDGLKFDGGNYRVWLGDDPDNAELIIQGAHYERSIHHRFYLKPEEKQPDPTNKPTPKETPEPTAYDVIEFDDDDDDDNPKEEIMEDEEDEEDSEDTTVFALSPAPTPIPIPSSSKGLYITIVIKLDNRPKETGWAVTLVKGQKLLSTRTMGFYKGKNNAIVTEKVYLEQADKYEDAFIVAFLDKGMNGLCCKEGPGFFQVFLGDLADGQILFRGESFGKMQQYEFSIEWNGGSSNMFSPTVGPKKLPLGPSNPSDISSSDKNDQTSSAMSLNGKFSPVVSIISSIGIGLILLLY